MTMAQMVSLDVACRFDGSDHESNYTEKIEQNKNILIRTDWKLGVRRGLKRFMISVVIPALNSEANLAHTLSCLVRGAAEELISQVIVVDGGSTDATRQIADAFGATIAASKKGRGRQLAVGANKAKNDWILFLHADTVLQDGWEREVRAFMEQVERTGGQKAAVFRFAIDDYSAKARRLEALVRFRCWIFALPYGDQGLLISRHLYNHVGGFEDVPLMEDVGIVKRLGRRRLVYLRSQAVTSARRFRQTGFFLQPIKNFTLLMLYFLKVPPHVLAKLYG